MNGLCYEFSLSCLRGSECLSKGTLDLFLYLGKTTVEQMKLSVKNQQISHSSKHNYGQNFSRDIHIHSTGWAFQDWFTTKLWIIDWEHLLGDIRLHWSTEAQYPIIENKCSSPNISLQKFITVYNRIHFLAFEAYLFDSFIILGYKDPQRKLTASRIHLYITKTSDSLKSPPR